MKRFTVTLRRGDGDPVVLDSFANDEYITNLCSLVAPDVIVTIVVESEETVYVGLAADFEAQR